MTGRLPFNCLLVCVTVFSNHVGAQPAASSRGSSPLRDADELYRTGQSDEALAAYDRAQEDALAAHDNETAFSAGYRAATVEHQRKRYQAAAERFRKLAIDLPKHNKAAGAHLLAIYDTAQLAREQPKRDSAGYLELLKEHLTHWPSGATAVQARLWLGSLYESRRQWRDAMSCYQDVALQPSKAVEAVAGVVRSCAQWLATMPAGEARQQAADEAIQWFEQYIVNARGEEIKPWPPASREAALAAARLWLAEVPHGFMQAHEVAAAALEKSPDAPAEWKNSIGIIKVAALARQGRVSEAAAALDKITAGLPRELQLLMDQLSQAAAPATVDRRQEIARLQLRVGEMLRGHHGLDGPARIHMEITCARALVELRQSDKAVAALERLVTEFPTSAEVREELASVLTASGAPGDLQKALASWQELARKTKPGSERWFRANYGLAEVQLLTGKPSQARRTIKATQASHPNLGGAEMKGNFLMLLKKSEQAQ